MTPFSVREAHRNDASTMYQFIVDLAEYEKARHEVKCSVADIERTVFSADSTAHALIGEYNGTPIAMAIYFFNYSTWLGKNGLYLEDLYVTPEHRSQGMGKLLMSRLAAIALEEDCGRMEWSVLDWNQPAIDVYNALDAVPQNEWIGYRLTGTALTRLANSND